MALKAACSRSIRRHHISTWVQFETSHFVTYLIVAATTYYFEILVGKKQPCHGNWILAVYVGPLMFYCICFYFKKYCCLDWRVCLELLTMKILLPTQRWYKRCNSSLSLPTNANWQLGNKDIQETLGKSTGTSLLFSIFYLLYFTDQGTSRVLFEREFDEAISYSSYPLFKMA